MHGRQTSRLHTIILSVFTAISVSHKGVLLPGIGMAEMLPPGRAGVKRDD
jgi:hypothetical protein